MSKTNKEVLGSVVAESTPVTWVEITLPGLTDKSVKMIKNMWPDAEYNGKGVFSVPVQEKVLGDRDLQSYQETLHNSACDFLGIPRTAPFTDDAPQLPAVTEPVEMPPVKAAKPEQGEVTYSAHAPGKTMEFRMGDATIAQIENVQRIFPALEHRGDGYFVLTLPNLGAVGDYHDPAVREQYASVIYKGVCDIMQNTSPGYVPPQQKVATEERQARPYDHFLTDPMNIPPRRGSNEEQRRKNIHAALQTADMSVPELVKTLKRHAEQLDPTTEEARTDVGILCLGVLGRAQAKIKKRKQRRITLGIAFAALLVAAGFTGTEFVKQNLVSSNYTTINECKVPFGDTELEAKRFRTYTYKSLLGYRFGGNNDVSVERMEVKLPGSDITILGRDLNKDKPWRLTYAKGEYGTALLKPSEQYWFVGNGDRTTLVNNAEFCH